MSEYTDRQMPRWLREFRAKNRAEIAEAENADLVKKLAEIRAELSLVRECWKIDMRAAREAEAKVAAVTALAEERHDHGLKACPTCYWQTRILSALGGMG